MQKRTGDDTSYFGSRMTTNNNDNSGAMVVVEQQGGAMVSFAAKNNAIIQAPDQGNRRTSGLQAQNLMLTGHESAIFSIDFDKSGENMCSADMDGTIMLWEVYSESKNYNVLKGHKNAVLEARWLGSTQIASCSADKTCALWDALQGVRVRKYADHKSIVNTVATSRDAHGIFASGSDDSTAMVWDVRNKSPAHCFFHDYQVTSVALSHDGQHLFTGGIDNIIRRFDLRSNSSIPDMELSGHMDTITGLSISPDGNYLLSNAMDNSLRMWDIKPFATDPNNRCERMFLGAQHGAEKNLLRCSWSCDQELVTCGSADRMVCVWEAATGKMVYYLPGHKGSVNDVAFHPKEPILASCSTDKVIFLGELSSTL